MSRSRFTPLGGGPRLADTAHAAAAVVGTTAATAGGGALVVVVVVLAAPAFIRYRADEFAAD